MAEGTESARPAGGGDEAPVVRAEGVTKTFFAGTQRENRVLDGVSLAVSAGRLCTILGPSGSGKTTLLSCLAGLESIDAGRVTVAGTDVHAADAAAAQRFRRETVAVIFQEYNLISDLTLRENIELSRRMPARLEETAAAWNVAHVLDLFPPQCSGGQQQKAAIIRALNTEVDVLFCDEPTGALDGTSAGEVLAGLQDVCRESGVTVVMITHNEMVTEISDQVVRIHDGVVRSDELVAAPRRAGELAW